MRWLSPHFPRNIFLEVTNGLPVAKPKSSSQSSSYSTHEQPLTGFITPSFLKCCHPWFPGQLAPLLLVDPILRLICWISPLSFLYCVKPQGSGLRPLSSLQSLSRCQDLGINYHLYPKDSPVYSSRPDTSLLNSSCVFNRPLPNQHIQNRTLSFLSQNCPSFSASNRNKLHHDSHSFSGPKTWHHSWLFNVSYPIYQQIM